MNHAAGLCCRITSRSTRRSSGWSRLCFLEGELVTSPRSRFPLEGLSRWTNQEMGGKLLIYLTFEPNLFLDSHAKPLMPSFVLPSVTFSVEAPCAWSFSPNRYRHDTPGKTKNTDHFPPHMAGPLFVGLFFFFSNEVCTNANDTGFAACRVGAVPIPLSLSSCRSMPH